MCLSTIVHGSTGMLKHMFLARLTAFGGFLDTLDIPKKCSEGPLCIEMWRQSYKSRGQRPRKWARVMPNFIAKCPAEEQNCAQMACPLHLGRGTKSYSVWHVVFSGTVASEEREANTQK